MKMDSLQQQWEYILKGHGMPAEPMSEAKKAKRAGIDVSPIDFTSPEALALSAQLKMEDPENVLGGFPKSIEETISLIQTLKDEWLEEGIPSSEVLIAIHSSCINGSDCVIVTHKKGLKYHYNTKHMSGYSREKLTSRLENQKISFIEK